MTFRGSSGAVLAFINGLITGINITLMIIKFIGE